MSCPSKGVVRIICSNHRFSCILFMVKNRRGAGRLSTMQHLSSPPRSLRPFSQIHSSMAQRVTFYNLFIYKRNRYCDRSGGLLDRFGRTVSSCLPPLNSFLATSTCLRK
ncbi:hypothetical protein BpHYR1_030858 [Brachionus plicatilis]|uniref:Uncharacterized protein n=1 Tax=Brachionus plicatilis TaxID=10195 RepID=A0A3M7Q2V4_BRAPC|nr:hypothetical protein BpHYR1_030858 [Brachionus plicatilis]